MDNSTIELLEKVMDKPIAFHRIFKTITGTTNAALFLSQAWYWSKNKTVASRQGWFYKTALDWEEETGLTRREQINARRLCREVGLIEEKLKKIYSYEKDQKGKSYGHATLHFRVNKNRVYELIESTNLKNFSLHQSAKLRRLTQSAKLLVDLPKAQNYLTEITRDYPTRQKGNFKNWKDTPEAFHPYFQACTNKPISLPEPTTQKEIKLWLETFDEWITKGFTPDQVVAAARLARKRDKAIARPGSLTWLLNDQHSRKNGLEDHSKSNSESILEKLAKNQRRK